jgi:hypothetical protein
MRGTVIRRFSIAVAMGLGICTAVHANSQNYAGNGATGFGGPVGNGSVSLSDDGTNLTATFNPSGGFTGNDLVVYIDSVAGGFADNSTFFDNNDGGRTAVSGNNTGNPSASLVSFPAGFGADYALEFENNVFTGLFQLASGGGNSLGFVTGATPTSGGPYTVTFPLSDIGVSAGGTFFFDGTLISTSAYRSNETIGSSITVPDNGGDAPNAGFNGSTTFTAEDAYTTSAVPEPTSLGLLGLGALALLRRRRGE